MNTNLTIRAANLADADIITEFNRRMARETEHKELDPAIVGAGVKAMLDDSRKGRYYVAESDGRVVGQLGITFEWSDWRNGNFWWIQSVYVDRDFRRHGVYRSLYEHVLGKAAEQGDVIGVRLYVERDNEAAKATYRKLGMSDAGYELMETSPLV